MLQLCNTIRLSVYRGFTRLIGKYYDYIMHRLILIVINVAVLLLASLLLKLKPTFE